MKNVYTKDTIIEFIKNLDVRAQKFSDAQIDNVINRGYAELTTTSKRIFSNEEVVDLLPYYESSELYISFDIEEDVTEVYDIYTTIRDIDNSTLILSKEQGVGVYRNSEVSYRDNRSVGRIHVKLDIVDEHFDTLVTKYYYTPTASTESVYMDSQTYLAWTDAMWAATNYFLKDIEGESQKRASMTRTSQSMPQEPEDIPEQSRAIFGGIL